MKEKIGNRLVRIGAMTRSQVNDVLKRQGEDDSRCFGEIAIALGYINDEAVMQYLEIKRGCPFQRDCHFFNIEGMTVHNKNQNKRIGKPVTITLWPSGKLQEV